MQFVRSVAAQCYRRGKPLGRRGFSSSTRRSFHSGGVDVVMKTGINVIQGMFNTSVGVGFGTGLGYLIMGYSNSSEYVRQVEEEWETDKRRVEESEAKLERLQKEYGFKRDV